MSKYSLWFIGIWLLGMRMIARSEIVFYLCCVECWDVGSTTTVQYKSTKKLFTADFKVVYAVLCYSAVELQINEQMQNENIAHCIFICAENTTVMLFQ